MPNDLVVIENQLTALQPRFVEALAGRMPVERLKRTVLVSIERTPKLLKCNPQTILNAAMTAAVLGLEVDGATGQAFLIPYGDRAQLVIGYRGMNTLAARSGYSVTASVVREGDKFDYRKGTQAFVDHRPLPGNKDQIIHIWAVAESRSLPPIIEVLGIDDILFVKGRSPGATKSDSPWNDPAIGFLAMAEKTARRRLSRSMPLNVQTQAYHLAARLDEAFEEQGQHSYIGPDGTMFIEGQATEIRNTTPTAEDLTKPIERNGDPNAVIREQGRIAAKDGMKSLEIWWTDLQREVPKTVRQDLVGYLDGTLKPMAAAADKKIAAEQAASTDQPEIVEG